MKDESPLSLLSLEGLTKPATVLIEKVADALGWFAEPRQIRRLAQAEADAAEIRALSDIKISDIQRRAFARMTVEETQNERNMEQITAKALPSLQSDAQPEDIENDWLRHFFDNSRLISDGQMQELWARLLAGEANNPSTFSKRTIEALSILEKREAEMLTSLCRFSFTRNGSPVVLYYGDLTPLTGPGFFVPKEIPNIYDEEGVTAFSCDHLEEISLIRTGQFRIELDSDGYVKLDYFGRRINIMPRYPYNDFYTGKVRLTETGSQLALLCEATKVEGFESIVTKYWRDRGYKIEGDYL